MKALVLCLGSCAIGAVPICGVSWGQVVNRYVFHSLTPDLRLAVNTFDCQRGVRE